MSWLLFVCSILVMTGLYFHVKHLRNMVLNIDIFYDEHLKPTFIKHDESQIDNNIRNIVFASWNSWIAATKKDDNSIYTQSAFSLVLALTVAQHIGPGFIVGAIKGAVIGLMFMQLVRLYQVRKQMAAIMVACELIDTVVDAVRTRAIPDVDPEYVIASEILITAGRDPVNWGSLSIL